MLLAINIGNTNINFGIFTQNSSKKNNKTALKFNLAVKNYSRAKLAKKLGLHPEISKIIICSVIPKLTKIVQLNLKSLTGINARIIGKDLAVPIKNLYHQPKQLGQDRLVNAYAASQLYSTPLIVIDSGTAITLDVVSKNRTFLGGLIMVGVEMSLAALNEKTALLPKIRLTQPLKLIGQDTKSSILSGIIFGTTAAIDELTKQIKRYLGKNTLIIGTGGNIPLIKRNSKIKIHVDKDLTLRGIKLINENEI